MKFILILLLFVLNLQSNVIVKSLNGNVTVNGNKVKKGDTLNLKSTIRIVNNSSITLQDKNGNVSEINKSGFYSVQKIISKSKKLNDVNQKLAESIFNEMGDAEDMLSSGNVNNNMQTLGAVERSTNNKLFFKDNASTYIVDDKYEFNWNYDTLITFTIKDIDDIILYEKSTISNNIFVNLEQVGLESGICYFFSISDGKNKSEEYCIYRMTHNEEIIFKQELFSVISNLKFDNSMDYLVLAKFYEKNKILNRACYNYEKAIELDNGSLYKVLYKNYLTSVGLIEKANSIKI